MQLEFTLLDGEKYRVEAPVWMFKDSIFTPVDENDMDTDDVRYFPGPVDRVAVDTFLDLAAKPDAELASAAEKIESTEVLASVTKMCHFCDMKRIFTITRGVVVRRIDEKCRANPFPLSVAQKQEVMKKYPIFMKRVLEPKDANANEANGQ
jgi:hypothetical protein